MDIVVDPSAVLAVLLNESSKAQLLEVTRGAELLSPPSLPWEIGNALTALLKRRRIDLAQAQAALDGFSQIPIRLSGIDMERAVETAGRHDIYAYDAYVIECARQHAAPLLSLDQRQCQVAAEVGIKTVEV